MKSGQIKPLKKCFLSVAMVCAVPATTRGGVAFWLRLSTSVARSRM